MKIIKPIIRYSVDGKEFDTEEEVREWLERQESIDNGLLMAAGEKVGENEQSKKR